MTMNDKKRDEEELDTSTAEEVANALVQLNEPQTQQEDDFPLSYSQQATQRATRKRLRTSAPSSSSAAIFEPTNFDVLCGRGNDVKDHPGNIHFRALVQKQKEAYVQCRKSQKPEFAHAIVSLLKERYGARFLQKNSDSGAWYEIDHKDALDKTRQALREGAPVIEQRLKVRSDSKPSKTSSHGDTNERATLQDKARVLPSDNRQENPETEQSNEAVPKETKNPTTESANEEKEEEQHSQEKEGEIERPCKNIPVSDQKVEDQPQFLGSIDCPPTSHINSPRDLSIEANGASARQVEQLQDQQAPLFRVAKAESPFTPISRPQRPHQEQKPDLSSPSHNQFRPAQLPPHLSLLVRPQMNVQQHPQMQQQLLPQFVQLEPPRWQNLPSEHQERQQGIQQYLLPSRDHPPMVFRDLPPPHIHTYPNLRQEQNLPTTTLHQLLPPSHQQHPPRVQQEQNLPLLQPVPQLRQQQQNDVRQLQNGEERSLKFQQGPRDPLLQQQQSKMETLQQDQHDRLDQPNHQSQPQLLQQEPFSGAGNHQQIPQSTFSRPLLHHPVQQLVYASPSSPASWQIPVAAVATSGMYMAQPPGYMATAPGYIAVPPGAQFVMGAPSFGTQMVVGGPEQSRSTADTTQLISGTTGSDAPYFMGSRPSMVLLVPTPNINTPTMLSYGHPSALPQQGVSNVVVLPSTSAHGVWTPSACEQPPHAINMPPSANSYSALRDATNPGSGAGQRYPYTNL